MAMKEELETEVAQIFNAAWSDREGRTVPEPEDLSLGNAAVKLDGTVLYADMSDSTKLVDGYRPWFAAGIYKAYLSCAARIVRANGGNITAYDGDRLMAVFIGASRNADAAKTGLKINAAVSKIINPAIVAKWPKVSFRVGHVVGIDASSLFASRIGVRKYNDLVWVGRAANYAAKLSAIKETNKVFITNDVFQQLSDDTKYGGNPRQLMWAPRQWSTMNNMSIHSSSWTWPV